MFMRLIYQYIPDWMRPIARNVRRMLGAGTCKPIPTNSISANLVNVSIRPVLPELIKQFDFKLFIAASSVVDLFIDRVFGHHFDVTKAWDLECGLKPENCVRNAN